MARLAAASLALAALSAPMAEPSPAQAQVRAVANLPDGQAGRAYEAISIVEGGSPPYATQIVAGDLPTGMAVDSNGALSGAPTQAGTFVFSLRIADGSKPPVMVEQTFRLHVNASPTSN